MLIVPTAVFLISLSTALAQSVDLFPPEWIVLPGANGSFTCNSHFGDVSDIEWIINGSVIDSHESVPFQEGFDPDDEIGTLHFTNISLSYNATMVQCGVYNSMSDLALSNSAELLIQGLLSAVDAVAITTSDSGSTLSLTWEPPFTLDITGVDPDIIYCVDVINSTSSVTLHSECGITETEFSYPLPEDAVCHSYVLAITPLNVVGRGVSSSLTYYIGTEAGPSDVLDVERMSESVVTNGKQFFSFIINMSAPVCVAEVISLVNIDTGTRESVADSELTITEDFAIMFTIPLPVNHHYNVTIRARNGAGTAVNFTKLSTHDIKTAEISSSTISVTYFSGSDSRGALLNQVCSTDINATSTFQTLDRSSRLLVPHNYTALTCTGQVQIFLYNIEESGTLSRGRNYPAVKQRVVADTQGIRVLPGPTPIHLRNCSLDTLPQFIRAKCAYPGDSGAMVTGFQVIAQPTDFNGLGTLYANYTTEGQTSAIVEVEQNGEFLVSVIPVLGETGIVNSSVEYSEVVVVEDLLTATGTTDTGVLDTELAKDVFFGAAIEILLLLVIVLCGIILVLCGKIRDRKLKSSVITPQVELELVERKDTTSAEIGEDQLYTEIKDPESLERPSTSSEVVRVAPDPTPTGPTSHHYDNVVLAEGPSPSGDYQPTLCAAYGVH